MTTRRRDFLRLSLGAAALLAAQGVAEPSVLLPLPAQERRKLRILILGGTGFLGPALVEAARPRGHALTLFNRGRTNPHLFPELEKLRGDRDPKKGEGLKSLEGREWDVVFDDCGYYPRHVKASAELLAPRVKHCVYVSSISCYAKNDVEGADESAACAVLEDPAVETMGKDYEHYGGLKALCEQESRRAFPERCTVVRPGYIVGPGDPTDRFTYWPWRIDRGGDVIVPGAKSDPIQVIDVRDLAEWMVRVAEGSTHGVYNACGPAERLSWGATIDACRAATRSAPRLHWVEASRLPELGLKDAFPIWAPCEGETRGYHTWSNARAVAAGLTFRPIEATAADTLAWFASLPQDRQARMKDAVSAEQLAQVLAAEK